MDKRIYNCIIISIVLFLLILLTKNYELFTSESPTISPELPTTQPESIKQVNNLEQISEILDKNKDELLKLEKEFENQQNQLDNHIKKNNDLLQQIKTHTDLHQKLMNQNNDLANKVISNISALAKKRGIKNVQQLVDKLINN
jgi:biopolymer transport protein ExbB/TolQ